MASFINLDSFYRDREVYPNENAYQVDARQTETWFAAARTTMSVAQNPSIKPREFATTVNIRYLSLPYTDDLAEMPIVFINFHSKEFKDIHLISSINGVQMDAKFVCRFDKIQNDRNGDPMWIHYQCNMEQTMRFKRGDPVVLSITTRSGNILPQQDTYVPTDADPTKQSQITFEITPYINDADYSNHTTTPFSF